MPFFSISTSHIVTSILSIIILLNTNTRVYSQDYKVEFISQPDKPLCPLNNGIPGNSQKSSLEISGPEDKTWFATYSIDGAPAQNINEGLGINNATYNFDINFRNDSPKLKVYTIRIEDAWLEDGSKINIPEDNRNRDLKVYPLTKPVVQEHESKIKTNSEADYTVIIGINSIYIGELPLDAKQISYQTEDIDANKYINFKVKWQNEAGITTFKSLEKTGFGCDSDTIYTSLELKNEFEVELGETQNICTENSIKLEPIIDLKSEYRYLWSTGEKTKSIEATKSGQYDLNVTDLRDNQIIKDQIEVIVHDAPAIEIDDVIILNTPPIQLDIQKKACTYLWSTGETGSAIEITSPGDYSVMITSEYGCTNSKSFTVKDPAAMFTLNLPKIVHMCGQESMTLSPHTDIDQAYTYLWSTGSTEREIELNTEGIYTLTATDPNGYKQTASSEVIYHSKPIVDLGVDFILWDGETKLLDAQNKGASYEWNTSESTQTIIVNSGGEFTVNVINEYGCANTDAVFADYRKGEKFRIDLGEDKSICEGDSVLIVPEIIGRPIKPLGYNWIGLNHNEPEIYLKKEGDFQIEITDALGNKESAQIHISRLPAPLVNLGEDILDCSKPSIELKANMDGESYNWSTGEISLSIEVKKSGKYWLKVTNDSQCSASDTINIKFLNDYPFVGLPKAFTPNGDSHNDVLLVRGVDIDKIKLMIYNRSGTKVFETSNLNQGWDGTYNGQLQKMDRYYYHLDITYINGVIINKTGNFSLLK